MTDFTVTNWNEARLDNLPADGEKVLWEYDNGHVVHTYIDSNKIDVELFLKGTKYTGPIVRWMKKPL